MPSTAAIKPYSPQSGLDGVGMFGHSVFSYRFWASSRPQIAGQTGYLLDEADYGRRKADHGRTSCMQRAPDQDTTGRRDEISLCSPRANLNRSRRNCCASRAAASLAMRSLESRPACTHFDLIRRVKLQRYWATIVKSILYCQTRRAALRSIARKPSACPIE